MRLFGIRRHGRTYGPDAARLFWKNWTHAQHYGASPETICNLIGGTMLKTIENEFGSFIQIHDPDHDGDVAIVTRCPKFDKEVSNTPIHITREMAHQVIAELTRLFPERRTGNDRRGPALKGGS